jgi:hypothetical protein
VYTDHDHGGIKKLKGSYDVKGGGGGGLDHRPRCSRRPTRGNNVMFLWVVWTTKY